MSNEPLASAPNHAYRQRVYSPDLQSYHVWEQESDLMVYTAEGLTHLARSELSRARQDLLQYARRVPHFLTSLSPVTVPPEAPAIAQRMAQAAASAGVGPLAAVAGAIADAVGEKLAAYTEDVIVENGGDIFMQTTKPRQVLIQAGPSAFSGRIALAVAPATMPLGICTSSGTSGHAFSFGQADAALVVAREAALADAMATAVGNRVQTAQDIEAALAFAASIPGVLGCLVIVQEHLGAWGDVELAQIREGERDATPSY